MAITDVAHPYARVFKVIIPTPNAVPPCAEALRLYCWAFKYCAEVFKCDAFRFGHKTGQWLATDLRDGIRIRVIKNVQIDAELAYNAHDTVEHESPDSRSPGDECRPRDCKNKVETPVDGGNKTHSWEYCQSQES